jgi:purine nucleoside phosphorylase
MTKFVLGIIDGYGIYELSGLKKTQDNVESPWGKPSAALLTGENCWVAGRVPVGSPGTFVSVDQFVDRVTV